MSKNKVSRAKQFSPFDALTGYSNMLAENLIKRVEKRELNESEIEELSKKLIEINPGDVIEVEYYDESEMIYKTVSGKVADIDTAIKMLRIGKLTLNFEDLSYAVLYQERRQ